MVKVFLSSVIGYFFDEFGRKIMLALAYTILAISLALMPGQTTIFPGLLLCRLLYAFGQLIMIVNPLLGDYVEDKYKGRGGSIQYTAGTIGCLLAIKLQQYFIKSFELDQLFYVSSAIVVAAGIIIVSCVRGGKYYNYEPSKKEEVGEEQVESTLQKLIYGFKMAANPWILLGYLTGFIVRGESYLIGNVIYLWNGTFYDKEHHQDAVQRSSEMNEVQFYSAIFSGLVFTYFIDRWNKGTLVLLANVLFVFSLLALIYIDNPASQLSLYAFAILGIGVACAFVLGYYIIARYSCHVHRGKASGAFSVIGNVSIWVCLVLGGYLFTYWKNAQFSLYILFSVITISVVLYFKVKGKLKE
eukprot:TRINITY_DN14288_c0_g1_i2.p1 TRINITY_DN14288_c0_g1~~TRINITY_DN14288_c0_g1_i2.p1  ORF type:complete len:357 (-),score=65.27 TRINITY_DN14288_c0_g1_i2:21-1091(-)